MTALMGLDARLKMARLYLVMDAIAEQHRFAELVEAVWAGGVDILQVRRGELSPEVELERLETARSLAFRHDGIVVAHGDAELAARFKADALHLGAADGPAAPARAGLHQWALLGRSTHSVAQLTAAAADPDVAYAWVGPVFDTNLRPPYPTPGPALVREAARLAPCAHQATKPWFAVGGINEHNLAEVVAAGARRIAVSSAITSARDPEAAARTLKDQLRQAWQDDAGMAEYVFAAFDHGPTAQLRTPGDERA